MGHANVHIFKKDFNPAAMAGMGGDKLLERLNAINALMRDHFMQLIEDMEKSTTPSKDARLVDFVKGQLSADDASRCDSERALKNIF